MVHINYTSIVRCIYSSQNSQIMQHLYMSKVRELFNLDADAE